MFCDLHNETQIIIQLILSNIELLAYVVVLILMFFPENL